MGGPMSPLTWVVAFDPVIWVTQFAATMEILGYIRSTGTNFRARTTGSCILDIISCLQTRRTCSGRAPLRQHLRKLRV